jgi:gluconate kinase
LTMPPIYYVKFTTTSGNVVCQRCKVSFPEGVELHFLHNLTGEGPGKKVCDECRRYYITKTQNAAQSDTGKFNDH